jgi:hypothetical protein
MNRNNCSTAISEKRPIAMMVKGFFILVSAKIPERYVPSGLTV